MHKKVILTALGAIILVSGVLAFRSAIPKPAEPVEKDQAQSINSEANKVVPTCEELNIPQEQIDAAVAEAIIDIKDPWGNERDFQLLLDRIEAKLGCTLQKSKGAAKAKDAQERSTHDSKLCNLISRRNYNYAMPGSWISKALRISRCALVTSVRI